MPVGTQAAIKGVHHDDVRASGADIMLANTYHLMLRPGRRTRRGARRLARIHALALSDPHRFRRLSGDVACRVAQSRGGGRHLPLAYRRRHGRAVAGTRRRSANPARLRYRHAARRMHRNFPPDEREIERAMQLSLRWAERCKRAFETRAGRPRAVRHRAGRRRSKLARGTARARSSTSASTATPSAALPSARRRR